MRLIIMTTTLYATARNMLQLTRLVIAQKGGWTPEEHPTYLGARLVVEEEEGGRMQEGQEQEGREDTTQQTGRKGKIQL